MELLLHYVWQHKLFPATILEGLHGEQVEVIDTGLHNTDAGPDFFNAKVKIDGLLWVGNVEIHTLASDWFRHGHDSDAAYDNTILHVCSEADMEVVTHSGRRPTQLTLTVPQRVADNYHELLTESTYPPCYRVIPDIAPLAAHAWLNRLTADRLEEKTARIAQWLERTADNWERVAFITLARNFGFGINSDAFEQWGATLPLHAAAKHRDDLFQVEALFMGHAGLLDDEAVAPERRDDYFLRLQGEWRYLAHKFSLSPIDRHLWRFLRLRPQNFPYVRLAQLAELYHARRTDFSALLSAPDTAALRTLLTAHATPYWQTHFSFGHDSARSEKTLRTASIDLLLINTVAPLLFAYGRQHGDDERMEAAVALLEALPPEHNHITRQWAKAGLTAAHAADSQGLIHLRRKYCDRKDCLRCRFGKEYLRRKPTA